MFECRLLILNAHSVRCAHVADSLARLRCAPPSADLTPGPFPKGKGSKVKRGLVVVMQRSPSGEEPGRGRFELSNASTLCASGSEHWRRLLFCASVAEQRFDSRRGLESRIELEIKLRREAQSQCTAD